MKIKEVLKNSRLFMKYFDRFRIWSIKSALRQQGYYPYFYKQLEQYIPDISDQYNDLDISSDYLYTNVRAMHCFQVQLIKVVLTNAYNQFKSPEYIRMLDIGDSCGNHILYTKKEYKMIKHIDSVSINTDKRSVEKIKKKGLQAYNFGVNNLMLNFTGVIFDLITMFQVFEHVPNPINALDNIKSKMGANSGFVLTVPYVKNSRVHLENWDKKGIEDVHIFELCPDDLKKLFDYCGFELVFDKIYYQYPKMLGLTWLLRRFWQRIDYEGFYGAVLKLKEK